MNKQPHIPDPETSKRLLANLRRSRMEVQEVNLELGEIKVAAKGIATQMMQYYANDYVSGAISPKEGK